METFTELKDFERNPQYGEHRRQALRDLTDEMMDKPIIDIINGFNRLPYCFTLQSCYGHFIGNGNDAPHNLAPLTAPEMIGNLKYKIAYIALCIDHNLQGNKLFKAFKEIPSIDLARVQFCCAEWFWKRQVNSYVLQVVPDRFKHQDTAMLDYEEALHIEKIRYELFNRLDELLKELSPFDGTSPIERR